jgi:hypothetical protein
MKGETLGAIKRNQYNLNETALRKGPFAGIEHNPSSILLRKDEPDC